MKFPFPFRYQRVRAFTLIETLVSVMIITSVVLGPLTVASNASSYAKQTKDLMTAVYLAYEATELLHHQQDTLYLRCVNATSAICAPLGNEYPNETAWRLFRNRLGYNSQGSSCYTADNPAGCTYDFIDMISNEDFDPPKYSAQSSSCSGISISTANVYVCNVHGQSAGFTQTIFTRMVGVASVKTFLGADEDYHDDLRVTVTVAFRRPNGFTRQVKVTDFFHARP